MINLPAAIALPLSERILAARILAACKVRTLHKNAVAAACGGHSEIFSRVFSRLHREKLLLRVPLRGKVHYRAS